ncbi:MAG: UDP-2,3-diacylglucosamine diphosphatase [Burkholderiaceae bacterium]|jgi:UDP-2,3-diacylglucosamine hydrolase
MSPGVSLQLEPRQQVLFVSDLHLLEDGDALTTRFLDWLSQSLQAHKPHWLMLLGDVFEAWIGDDVLQDSQDWPRLRALLQQHHQAGLQIGLVHGNRDFLLGQGFCQSVGARLLPDPFVLTQANGQRWLVSHGDGYCTDDLAYQQFRQMVRDPKWQADFLGQPLATRQAQARALREQSQQEKHQKDMAIMDVNPQAVDQAILAHGAQGMIHGHTHRPGVYQTPAGYERWVLTDWSIDPPRQGGLLLGESRPTVI